jgi:hypothetical protein
MAVVSLPSPLYTLILMVSPMFATSGGLGHWPLMPTKGREKPSGLARTHPIFQVNARRIGAGFLGVRVADGYVVDLVEEDTGFVAVDRVA